MKIEFQFFLLDHGWAQGKLLSRGNEIAFDASYIYDSIELLILGTIGLLTDKQRILVPFCNEPGEHHLTIEKLGSDKIEIQLQWFEDYVYSNYDTTKTPLVKLKEETTLKSFITSTCLSIERIYSENGSEGYYRKWRREFPINDYKKLLQLAQSLT